MMKPPKAFAFGGFFLYFRSIFKNFSTNFVFTIDNIYIYIIVCESFPNRIKKEDKNGIKVYFKRKYRCASYR